MEANYIIFKQHETAVFVGEEQEGPLAGEPTFFVVGDCPNAVVKQKLTSETSHKATKPSHIYLGAGNNPTSDLLLVLDIAEFAGSKGIKYITVETSRLSPSLFRRLTKFFPNTHIFWMLNSRYTDGFELLEKQDQLELQDLQEAGMPKSNILIKCETKETVYVLPLSAVQATPENAYGSDVVLWRSHPESEDNK